MTATGVEAQCFCRHNATQHHRDRDGFERCVPGCKCYGFVTPRRAGLCTCGHWASAHTRNMACQICKCEFLHHVPKLPAEQLAELKSSLTLTTVVVPMTLADTSDEVKILRRVPVEVNAASDVILIYKDNGLYFIAKHPDKGQVAEMYADESAFAGAENNLRALQEHLR